MRQWRQMKWPKLWESWLGGSVERWDMSGRRMWSQDMCVLGFFKICFIYFTFREGKGVEREGEKHQRVVTF